jgi:hypothetical protein
MTHEKEREAAALLAQAEANRIHAAFNPNLTARQRKRLERVAKDMTAHAFKILGPVDPEIAALSTDELLALLEEGGVQS